MSEPALPLVVSGPSGSGKSALLSNWLLHYRRRLELRPKHGGPLEEPFIFCHAVGYVIVRKCALVVHVVFETFACIVVYHCSPVRYFRDNQRAMCLHLKSCASGGKSLVNDYLDVVSVLWRVRSRTQRCTRHGVDVNQLLWRLLADLKHRFDLSRTVPNEAERLSWELPRFLDLARRKGRVIIVIDGLHRLQDKHGESYLIT